MIDTCPMCGRKTIERIYRTELDPVGIGTIKRLQSIRCTNCNKGEIKEIFILTPER